MAQLRLATRSIFTSSRLGKSSFDQFNSEFANEWKHKFEHAGKSSNFWRNATFFGAVPAILLCMGWVYYKEQEDHHKKRQPFVHYEHLRVINKRFPWGDGKTSFFHNPVKNPLPPCLDFPEGGYVVPDPNEGHHEEHH